MKTGHRPRATLGLKKANIPHLLGRAKSIYKGIAGHPAIFAQPNPPLATLETRIAALDQAQQDAATRARGMAAVRDVKAEELISSLESCRAYVQDLVDQSPEQGGVIIEAAAMLVGVSPKHAKPLLAASQVKPGAPVRLEANVGLLSEGLTGRVFFKWQSSTNGGITWDDQSATAHGRTELEGLPPLMTCAFRVCVTGAKGATDWSQAVTLLVH